MYMLISLVDHPANGYKLRCIFFFVCFVFINIWFLFSKKWSIGFVCEFLKGFSNFLSFWSLNYNCWMISMSNVSPKWISWIFSLNSLKCWSLAWYDCWPVLTFLRFAFYSVIHIFFDFHREWYNSFYPQ